MPSTKKPLLLLMFILLVLAACSDGEETTSNPLEGAAVSAPTATVASTQPPANPTEGAVPATEPVPTEAETVAESEPETVAPEPTASEAETAPPVEASQINGTYEQTYFRGSATAAVTMIDYSDFL